MSDKIRLVVDEEASIVARIDALAESEGLSRSDILRRAIRQLLSSLSNVPIFENSPKKDDQVTA